MIALSLELTHVNGIFFFRLFSDGGNFCTAEVSEYSKRLEKAAQKIDAMEQQLYAELKTVEPKLVEQSIKIVQSFEDR
jgi:hypothetical protein